MQLDHERKLHAQALRDKEAERQTAQNDLNQLRHKLETLVASKKVGRESK